MLKCKENSHPGLSGATPERYKLLLADLACRRLSEDGEAHLRSGDCLAASVSFLGSLRFA